MRTRLGRCSGLLRVDGGGILDLPEPAVNVDDQTVDARGERLQQRSQSRLLVPARRSEPIELLADPGHDETRFLGLPAAGRQLQDPPVVIDRVGVPAEGAVGLGQGEVRLTLSGSLSRPSTNSFTAAW